MEFNPKTKKLVGKFGSFPVADDDEVTKKLAMLIAHPPRRALQYLGRETPGT